MGALQMTESFGGIQLPGQTVRGHMPDRSALVVVSGFLETALRLWDEDRVLAKSKVTVAAALLHDHAGGRPPTTAFGGSGLAPWQARKVKEFIEASLDVKIRLGDCARQARLSCNYFSYVFKTTFGTTVGQYIRDRRVARAKQIMLRSNEPLSHVALACGFADQAHYCRVFRDVVGVSPGVWRRHNRP